MAAIFQTTFSNALSCMEIVCNVIPISLDFVSKSTNNNIPAIVQILSWC